MYGLSMGTTANYLEVTFAILNLCNPAFKIVSLGP